MRGVDRRTVVVGLASLGGSAAILLSGCGPRAAARDADGGATDNGANDLKGDERLLAVALQAEQFAIVEIERTLRRHPQLRAATRSALVTHQAHVRLLRGTGPRSTNRTRPFIELPAVPRRPEPALAVLVQSEARLSADHVTTAMAARSGALARVVASMAAASAQLEQVLAQASPGAGAGNGSGAGG